MRPGPTEVIGALGVVAISAAALLGSMPLAAATALALLVPAAVIDVHEHRLPDIWIATAVIGLALAIAAETATGHSLALPSIVIGSLAMSLPIFVLHVASPAAMGFGDVKLALTLGAALGTVDWLLAMVALCIAALLAATWGLAARRHSVPFGPFLVFGSAVSLIVSDPILAAFETASATS